MIQVLKDVVLIDVPSYDELEKVYLITKDIIVEEISRRYIQSKIENEVEDILNEKQDKYIDEIKLQIIKKNKGPENTKTLKKYAQFNIITFFNQFLNFINCNIRIQIISPLLFNEFQKIANNLRGKEIIINTKLGNNGKLFGTITSKDICNKINSKFNLNIDKKKISFEQVKSLGNYPISIKLCMCA